MISDQFTPTNPLIDCGAEPRSRDSQHLTFDSLFGSQPHLIARTEINTALARLIETDLGLRNVRRAPVSDKQVNWAITVANYNPPFIDIPRGSSSARKLGDKPHPANARSVAQFTSIFASHIVRDAQGRPLNPMGRTGLQGRGMLDKWGETAAADLILTRRNPHTGQLEVAAIKRSDTGEWALPGGKMEDGETPEQTALREFKEEAGGDDFKLDISSARLVYRGYGDDSRNTDNAWLATTCFHKHATPEQAETISLQARSDAVAAAWISPLSRFFGIHGRIVREVMRSLKVV